MKRTRHTAEEVVKKLREAEGLLAGGTTVEEVCRKLEITAPTFYRWQKEYAGGDMEAVKRMKELESENARLKRVVADQALEIALQKELNRGKW